MNQTDTEPGDRLVDDAALRERFRAGDVAALDEVYAVYARDVFLFLRRGFRVNDSGSFFKGLQQAVDLEDTVQEVFLRAFREPARMRYDGLRPYRAYLLAIAKNLVIDEMRRRARFFVPAAGADDGQDPSPSTDPEASPEAMHLRQEMGTVVRRFIDSLDQDERPIFEVRFRQGASVEATAAALKISEYRVKRTERLLRKRAFVALREGGYLEDLSMDAIRAMLLMALIHGVIR